MTQEGQAQTVAKAEKKPKKSKVPQAREELLQEARTLLKLWLRIRDFLLLAFQSDAIERDQEQSFLDLKSETAKSQRVVSGKIPEDLQFGADKITDFLRQAISISHLRSLPLADKRGLVGGWHVASVMLHRAVGAIEFINETQATFDPKSRKRLRTLRDIKSEAAGSKRKNILPTVVGAIVVIAVIAAVAYFLFGIA